MDSFPDHDKNLPEVGSSHFSDDFKARTKTHRLFGLWVADLLGLNVENSEEYVEYLLMINLFQGDEISLLEKAHNDLLEKNIFVSESHLQNQMDYFWDITTEQETKPS